MFEVYMLNVEGRLKANTIQSNFEILLKQIEYILSDEYCVSESRELSICKTKLEEACFYAKRAMAMQKCNQVIEDNPTVEAKNV